jgi:hypothetical protein
MTNEFEKTIDEIEDNIFTHNGKFPKGFEFIKGIDILESGKISAVYLLWNEGELLYVGQSYDVAQRIRTHKKEGRIPFTEYAYLAIHPEVRTQMETHLINQYKPKYNRYIPKLWQS